VLHSIQWRLRLASSCSFARISLPPPNPSCSATSFMKKYVNKAIINGSNTNIQEIALNPLEHNQFNTQAQMTRNNALVNRVSILNLLKAALIMPIAPNTKYNCAGVSICRNQSFPLYTINIQNSISTPKSTIKKKGFFLFYCL
jgi:hypothetical protein